MSSGNDDSNADPGVANSTVSSISSDYNRCLENINRTFVQFDFSGAYTMGAPLPATNATPDLSTLEGFVQCIRGGYRDQASVFEFLSENINEENTKDMKMWYRKIDDSNTITNYMELTTSTMPTERNIMLNLSGIYLNPNDSQNAFMARMDELVMLYHLLMKDNYDKYASIVVSGGFENWQQQNKVNDQVPSSAFSLPLYHSVVSNMLKTYDVNSQAQFAKLNALVQSIQLPPKNAVQSPPADGTILNATQPMTYPLNLRIKGSAFALVALQARATRTTNTLLNVNSAQFEVVVSWKQDGVSQTAVKTLTIALDVNDDDTGGTYIPFSYPLPIYESDDGTYTLTIRQVTSNVTVRFQRLTMVLQDQNVITNGLFSAQSDIVTIRRMIRSYIMVGHMLIVCGILRAAEKAAIESAKSTPPKTPTTLMNVCTLAQTAVQLEINGANDLMFQDDVNNPNESVTDLSVGVRDRIRTYRQYANDITQIGYDVDLKKRTLKEQNANLISSKENYSKINKIAVASILFLVIVVMGAIFAQIHPDFNERASIAIGTFLIASIASIVFYMFLTYSIEPFGVLVPDPSTSGSIAQSVDLAQQRDAFELKVFDALTKYLENSIRLGMILQTYYSYGNVNYAILKEKATSMGVQEQLQNGIDKSDNTTKLFQFERSITRTRIEFIVSLMALIGGTLIILHYAPNMVKLILCIAALLLVLIFMRYLFYSEARVRNTARQYYWIRPTEMA